MVLPTSKKLTVALFALIVFAIPLISLLSPYRTVSARENRELASFPEVSFDQIISKSFMSGFSDFISDHIAFRDQWTTVKTVALTIAGRRDSRDVYLGSGRLIENIAAPDVSVYRSNARAINKLAATCGKPVSLLLAPTAAEVDRAQLPAFAVSWDQKKLIGTVGREIGAAQMIDVLPTLENHRGEYIYYRTDHHWTTLGAYYAYAAAGKTLGYTPEAKNDFTMRRVTSDFLGTLYRRSGYPFVRPDDISLWLPRGSCPPVHLTIGAGAGAKTYDSLYFTSWLKQADKYSVFLNGNQALETVDTGHSGKRLLIVKDSYAHSLVPFLAAHFSRITLVDMRYQTQPLAKAVDLSSYDQILFVYNVDTFNTDNTIRNIL